MKAAGIVGMGLWTPPEVRSNDAWPESFVQSFHEHREQRRAGDFTDIGQREADRPYEAIFRRFAAPYEDDPFKGASRRHVTSPDEPTIKGDATAAMRALEDAGVDPKDVDLVVSSALVPDRLVPSNGPAVQHLTGCVNAAAIGVESYCSAALSQLDLAAGLVQAGRSRFVLCVQSHQIARANDLDAPSSPIFGDASTAFVVGAVAEGKGLLDLVRGGDGSLAGGVTWAYKKTPGAAWWRDADGPVHPGTDDMQAARTIADNVLAFPIDTIREVCSRNGVPLDGVAAFVSIQPLVWYQAAIAEGLGVPEERVPSTYASYAHVGAAGVIANLIEARRRRLLRDDSLVVLYAHGAGITRYGALLRWSSRHGAGP